MYISINHPAFQVGPKNLFEEDLAFGKPRYIIYDIYLKTDRQPYSRIRIGWILEITYSDGMVMIC